jgi:S-adenosylmethionine:tRNA ribosyltransferase-isomerase
VKRSDFYYELPPELIAQSPREQRDASRLLVIHKENGRLEHKKFTDLVEYLRPNDCLIVNDSKVLPARLIGGTESGGTAELLLLEDVSKCGETRWRCLAKPGRRLTMGKTVTFGGGLLTAVIAKHGNDGEREAVFTHEKPFLEVLDELGQMPLPPYIRESLEDAERYQTVYAAVPGSAAAPTAGLHFTHELLNTIKAAGVAVAAVTLHVGLGTFRPVKTENVEDHVMHAEWASLPRETAEVIRRTRENGGRVFAVGTTVCRTLESFAGQDGEVQAKTAMTDMFITPGYRFKAINALITNFHLPESTLMMLVSAMAGRETVMNAYAEAVKEKYRFFSFGDACLIL